MSNQTEVHDNGSLEGLTDAQFEFFEENGFVGPFTLYQPQDAVSRWNRAKLEMVLSKNKPHKSTIINYDRHLDCATLSEHVTHPEIVSKLRSLMGKDIMCWKTNIFPKYPGDAATGWHQVETFAAAQVGEKPIPALKYTEKTPYVTSELTVWTAFTPAHREQGCMTFIPGTHKKWYYDETKPMTPKVEAKRNDFFGYDYSELKIDKNWDPDSEEFVRMEMEAGQFVIFLAKCVHGSLPNTTKDQTRMGFASRYVSPSVKVYDSVSRLREFGDEIDLAYHGCVVVSGTDKYGYNKIHEANLNGYRFNKPF
jgi:non-heme Fe2+,alpha-ketoglutarate-dependent halogenase